MFSAVSLLLDVASSAYALTNENISIKPNTIIIDRPVEAM
jgi:hypothetical protein